jgi:hypothetical protein
MPQMPNVVAAAVQVYPNVVAAWILFLNEISSPFKSERHLLLPSTADDSTFSRLYSPLLRKVRGLQSGASEQSIIGSRPLSEASVQGSLENVTPT